MCNTLSPTMFTSSCFGKTKNRTSIYDSRFILTPDILPFSSSFQLSIFVPTVLCLFNNLKWISSKKYNYLSSLSLKKRHKIAAESTVFSGLQFNELTPHCLPTYVCLVCTGYILVLFDGSLVFLWSS